MNYLNLYGITDRRYINGSLEEAVEQAIAGGMTCLQLREKNLDNHTLLKYAKSLNAICKSHQIPLIINDDIHIAIESQAAGVHLGQNDTSIIEARKKLGPDRIIGVTAKTLEQAKFAEKNGADYLGVGAVFNTSTKLDTYTIDHDVLKSICNAVSIPVVAIGGINKDNAGKLKNTGIAGIAVVSSLFNSDNIQNSAKVLSHIAKDL